MSVETLGDSDHRQVWHRFYADFAFRPSTNRFQWPGISEPPGSVTWSLTALDDDPEYLLLDRLVSVVRRGLTACADELYALDWHHDAYRFPTAAEDWPLSPFPDGDYYIYLTPDFRLGTFGHPWEYTLCVFGDELVTAISAELTAVLGEPLRRSA
ncbi:DUF2716 domain-containing protein [Amycolatopsis regifaucium]|uniref:DUF2716 domain-containing protein n=1 Tax=Amycolatopsis regifaucium TaxID=546365 RepID=A0A154MUM3_9PSEU|nr:DUF2716 domain-containing protein [Amycolatopsis regifaucium]KZB87633.1 hypothetical protein AVL48_23780 [Amycolatopsis regifaucium]OKA05457.1 hypothetical protein ATP06_0225495 [Amycolatopsis regifaucium]SFI11320.1 Protein of unknown function [Amycolatopsis regifaucium]